MDESCKTVKKFGPVLKRKKRMIVPRQKNKNKKNKTIEPSESSDDDQEELATESDDRGNNILEFSDDDHEDEVSEELVVVEELLDSKDFQHLSPEMCHRHKMSVIRLNVDILMYFFCKHLYFYISDDSCKLSPYRSSQITCWLLAKDIKF